MTYGTVTVWVEGTEDEVHESQERIMSALHALDIPMDISEDVGEYEPVAE